MTIHHVEVPNPWFLLAALLALPALYWSMRGTGRVVFSSLRALPAGGNTWRTRLAWLPDAMMALSIVCFAIALAGPRKGDEATRVHREGIGVVMAVDVSGSMHAQDLADGKRSASCNYDEATDPTRLGAVKRVFSLIWAISAAVAGFAGVLLAPIAFIHTNVGFLGLKAFPAAVLGGFGSIPGALVGGIVIGVVETLSGFYLPEGFKDVAAYILLLVVLMVRPEGLFGLNLHKKV